MKLANVTVSRSQARQNPINTFHFTQLVYEADNALERSDDEMCEVLTCDSRLQLISVLLLLTSAAINRERESG